MDYTKIGFTQKTHGVAGELKVFIEEAFEDLFLEKDRVFLEIRGGKQPFFVESVRGGGALIVKFEDVKNREEAILLQSKSIFLPTSEVPKDTGVQSATLKYQGIQGFLLFDRTAGEIGAVEEVLDMPLQEMALVHYRGREVLIPLNPQFVQSVDTAARRVWVDLPEGLLDL